MRSIPDIPHYELVSRVLNLYGISDGEIISPQSGYRNIVYPVRRPDPDNPGYKLCVILYKNESGIALRIKNANRLGNHLLEKGLPVRYPLDPRIVKISSKGVERFAGLYNYLPGQTIPWEAYSQAHIKLVGATMAKMHAAFESLTNHALPEVAGEYISIMRRLEAYFSDIGVQKALKAKLGLSVSPHKASNFIPFLAGCRQLPNQQPLHMDFVRSNLLFDQKIDEQNGLTISGILDFEKAAYGHPTFDIARTLAFLLVDCKYKPQDKVRKYFLASGYVKRGRSELGSLQLLDRLTDMFLLYDFYKFLLHNPYQYLDQNEHFIRTRDLLTKHGLIRLEKSAIDVKI